MNNGVDSMPTDFKVAGLEEKYMLSILLFLKDNDRCKKIDLYRAVSTNPRMPQKLAVLEDMGLLHIEEDGKISTIILSEKGKAICALVEEMEKSL